MTESNRIEFKPTSSLDIFYYNFANYVLRYKI